MISCQSEGSSGSFTVASWNTYAFFDGRDDGTEYSGFRLSDGYTRKKYEERIKTYAVFLLDHLEDADVLMLEELESEAVLQDLLEAGLKKAGFQWYGLAQAKRGYLSVGFLSKWKPEEINVHGIEDERLILSLTFVVRGEHVRVLGIHGKSKVSDTDGEVRKEEFKLLSQLADESEDMLTILCGDFNADPSQGGEEMGLLREVHSWDCPLLITGDGWECESGIFYSPFWDYGGRFPFSGTYYYDGEWSFLDNILLNRKGFDGEGWEFESAKVWNVGDVSDYAGCPVKYDASTGKGYSDHFAISSTFRYH